MFITGCWGLGRLGMLTMGLVLSFNNGARSFLHLSHVKIPSALSKGQQQHLSCGGDRRGTPPSCPIAVS